MNAADVARELGKAKRSGRGGWSCLCPAHEDRMPSFSIADGEDGRLLVRCHAGCDFEAIRDALQRRGLWPQREREPRQTKRRRPSRLAPKPEPEREDLAAKLEAYRAALPGSPGEAYLRARRIPLELAQACGVGYAAPGAWAHRSRDCPTGRVVFPHHAPPGGRRLVNLYGRTAGDAPRHMRHDHLPGPKGWFTAAPFRSSTGPLFVTEGAFDALALAAAGAERAVAIFGVTGWRWDWCHDVAELVLAFDADQAGDAWRELARQGAMRGKRVSFLPPASSYAGAKDAAEAWAAGKLGPIGWRGELEALPEDLRDDWDERAAILMFDEGLSELEAEHRAFLELREDLARPESARDQEWERLQVIMRAAAPRLH